MTEGKLITVEAFHSAWINARPIFIWLPPGYEVAKRYAVLYIHDGQMLFDDTKTGNDQHWEVDKIITRLRAEKSIRDVIVVGIPNNGLRRSAEYFPQAILDYMPEHLRTRIIHDWLNDNPQADHYLKFITGELKPFIDKNYSTFPDRDHTYMMGASMGGLISLYAICRYPQLFHGVACLSTHWPLLHPLPDEEELMVEVPGYFQKYLVAHLPDPESHLIYFDHGTVALDSLYAPAQNSINVIMKAKGYQVGQWMTRVFEGEDHSERAWGRRLAIPLLFLLGIKG